ncbi:MAG: glycine cleavage system protein T [Alteromonadaceae bacterium]|nr:glycine cleavage system protein T [Alteromonadaceae bacterium]
MQPQQVMPANLNDLPANFVVPLDAMAGVQLTGEDASTFLHSQLTVDVKKLAEGQVRRTAHCDFKGKSWSISLLARSASAFILLAPQAALNATTAQLQKYGVFSKITIAQNQPDYRYFCVTGDAAKAQLKALFPTLPDTALTLSESPAGMCLQLDYPAETLLVGIHSHQVETFEELMAQSDIGFYAEAVFAARQIQSGIPWLTAESQVNQYVPQMMNLQALNAIDFNKGCYMGQEVVARTRYLGKNKRAAMVFKLNTALSSVQTTNDEAVQLEKQAGEHWRSGGTILQLAELGEETWILAIVNNNTTFDDVFRLSTFTSAELIHCDLPYTLD